MKLKSNASNISGGFAQSVALARVFVNTKASIIILDEALTQMDAYKKREIIFPRLEEFARVWGMILIVISHHLKSVEHMDMIYVLHEGDLKNKGSHKQLIESNAEVYLKLLGIKPKKVEEAKEKEKVGNEEDDEDAEEGDGFGWYFSDRLTKQIDSNK